jgi:hypothetical protein
MTPIFIKAENQTQYEEYGQEEIYEEQKEDMNSLERQREEELISEGIRY